MSGFYVIFEGSDGAGKSTVMERVAVALEGKLRSAGLLSLNIIRTQHPGSTPLGRHIRQLVKYPHRIDKSINFDDLSRQMLYMVDTINFVKTLLEPSLAAGRILFADRNSYISAMAYGLTDGLDLKDIERLFDILTPPKADKLIVLQVPAAIARERVRASRDDDDHYDQKDISFFERVSDIYDNLITRSAEQTALVSRSVRINDVMNIDATLPIHKIVDIVTAELYKTYVERCVASSAE